MYEAFGEMLDTSPAARKRYYELLRQATPEQKAQKVASLNESVREMARAGIRRQHPEFSDEQVRRELAIRMYGEAIAAKMFALARKEK